MHTLMENGFLEPHDSGFYSRAISADVPRSGGWPREGQSRSPHGWGPMRTWRDACLRQAGSASPAAQSWLRGQQDGEMRTCSPSYFPPSAQSRATGHWWYPRICRPQERFSSGSWLVEKATHGQQREVSPKWTVNCLQARETCMIRTFRIGPGPWLGRDPAPAPWPLSFPCQLSRNPGQFQSLRLRPA